VGNGCFTPRADARNVPASPILRSVPPKTLTVAYPVDLHTLDPRVGSDAVSFAVINQYAECLVGFRGDALEPAPGLAESWEGTAGGRRWTFRLRPKIVLSDGSPISAPEIAAWLSAGRTLGAVVTAPDDRRLVFDLPRAEARFPERLAQLYHAVARRTGTTLLGTGPYRIVSRTVGSETVLERNPHHAGTPPPIERVVFRVVGYSSLISKALDEGTIDLADAVTPSMLLVLRKSPRVRLEYLDGMNTGSLIVNTTKSHLDDVRFRRAIAHSIDRRMLVERVLPSGHGSAAASLLPPRLAVAPPPVCAPRDPG
jgi:peptide/nickel transport system substrate-binding protein